MQKDKKQVGRSMINKIIFEDEIVLYWDKQWELAEKAKYRISLNGSVIGTTEKTHFTLKRLEPKTAYTLVVVRIDSRGYAVETLLNETVCTPKARKRIDITKAPYYAIGDGKTLNTEAIQRAIDHCKEGETVYIPAGTYLSGALRLHSDMELYIETGAVLQGTSEVKDYLPKIKSRFEGLSWECYSSLLNMGELDHKSRKYFCKNVILRGGGSIYGGGKTLMDNVIATERVLLKKFMEENVELVKSCDKPDVLPARARPRLINMSNCKNITIGNLNIGHGPSWNVHFVYSKDIITYSCTISSKGVWNGDGWDPDSSEDCTIFNTTFDTHDDAIAIKSGRNPEGNVVNRPTKNVRVFDCRGTRGVSIGSELSGGIENVFVWDCQFEGGGGLNLKTSWMRGGYVKNIKAKDCIFAHIRMRTDYGCNQDGEAAGTFTQIENIELENVESLGCTTGYYTFEKVSDYALRITGFKEKEYHIQCVNLKNVYLHVKEGEEKEKVWIENVANLKMENVEYIR